MKVELTDRPYWTGIAKQIIARVDQTRDKLMDQHYAKQNKWLVGLFGYQPPDIFDPPRMYGFAAKSLAEDLLVSLTSNTTGAVYLDGNEVSYLLHWAEKEAA